MRAKKTQISLVSVGLTIVTLLIAPILLPANPLCSIDVTTAQDNPCLAQEATISAQQVQILQLEATNAELTERLARSPIISTPMIIEVVVTATPLSGSSEIESAATPTLALPAIANDFQMEIVEVMSPGDITAEGVVIRNHGGTIDITSWTLSDTQGNTFTFPEQLLFSNASLTIFTRVGQDTPVSLYWGLSQAVWGEPGDIVILIDMDGVVQAVFLLETE
jgi:hypothetical protein